MQVTQLVVILAQVLQDIFLAFLEFLCILFCLLVASSELAVDILDSIHPFTINVRIRL